jgi:cytochrome c oxidase cbb3-type subunit 4
MSDAYGWILSLWQLWLVVLFIAIVAWAFWPKNKRRFERHGEIPLRNDDDRGP